MLEDLPTAWQDSPAAKTAKNLIRKILQEDFSRSNLLALNDPGLCRFMPLWLEVFHEAGVVPVFIHLLRHPWEVACSLQVRHGTDLSKGHLLWARYNRDALAACMACPSIRVTYDQVLADPVSSFKDIAEALDIVYPLGLEDRYQEILGCVKAESKHFHFSRHEEDFHFSHVFWLYDQLRLGRMRSADVKPDLSHAEGERQGEDRGATLADPLMRKDAVAPFTRLDVDDGLSLFDDFFGFVNHCERLGLDWGGQPGQGVLKPELSADAVYARVCCFGGPQKDVPPDSLGWEKIVLPVNEPCRFSWPIQQTGVLKSIRLQFNFTQNPFLLHVLEICVKQSVTGEVLWGLDKETGFDACRVEKEAFCLYSGDQLLILSSGHEICLLLPASPELPDLPLSLEVLLQSNPDMKDLSLLWARHEAELTSRKTRIEELIKKIEILELDLKRNRKSLASLKGMHETAESENRKARDRLEAVIKEKQGLLTQLETQLKDGKETIVRLEGRLADQESLSRTYFSELAKSEQALIAAQGRAQGLMEMIRTLEKDFNALTASVRWRIGNKLTRCAEALLLRKKQPLAVDHMREVFERLRKEPPGGQYPSLFLQKPFKRSFPLKTLNKSMRQLQNDLQALKNSKSWRLGNALIRGLEILTFTRRRELAVDHLEKIFEAYEKIPESAKNEKSVIKLLKRCRKDFYAIENSARWRTGKGIFSFFDAVSLRGKRPTVMDHIHGVFKEYDGINDI